MSSSPGHSSSDVGGKAPQQSAAFGVKQAFDVEAETIRRSHHLNEDGMRAAMEEAYEGAVWRYEAEIEHEATERVVAAQTALFRLSSGHDDYRVALDRAEYRRCIPRLPNWPIVHSPPDRGVPLPAVDRDNRWVYVSTADP